MHCAQHGKMLLPPKTRLFRYKLKEHIIHVCPWWKCYSPTLEHALASCGPQVSQTISLFTSLHSLPCRIWDENPLAVIHSCIMALQFSISLQEQQWERQAGLLLYSSEPCYISQSGADFGPCVESRTHCVNTRLKLLGQECVLLNTLCTLDSQDPWCKAKAPNEVRGLFNLIFFLCSFSHFFWCFVSPSQPLLSRCILPSVTCTSRILPPSRLCHPDRA